ncbi:hypothetical protein ACJX0J_012324, partial [Zea mays]
MLESPGVHILSHFIWIFGLLFMSLYTLYEDKNYFLFSECYMRPLIMFMGRSKTMSLYTLYEDKNYFLFSECYISKT